MLDLNQSTEDDLNVAVSSSEQLLDGNTSEILWKPYQCGLCGCRFQDSNDLPKHINEQHQTHNNVSSFILQKNLFIVPSALFLQE